MKRNLFFSFCAILLVSVLFLGGCQKQDNTLKVATNAEFAPFEFLNSSNAVVGFDIDLINEIAAKLNMSVALDNMEFDGVVAAVQSGVCKVAISGLTITPTREKSVIFSDSYYSTTQVLITREGDEVFTGATKDELDAQLVGKTIGVCAGFTGQFYVEGDEDSGFAGIADAKTTIFDNISLAITALKNNSIDVIVMDSTVAKQAVAAAGNEGTQVIDVVLTTEYYAIALNQKDTELKGKIDVALKEIKDSGKLDELYEKWEVE